MKHFITIILFITCSMTVRAADLLPGYVVWENKDTLRCKIKGGRFLADVFRRVTIIHENGEEEALPSKDKKIIAFGFVERMMRYDYLFVDVGDKLENGFYQLVVDGRRYKLYGRPATTYGGNPIYVLFNPAGDFTKFEPCMVCPWKKQLRALLKDDAKALAAVEDAPRVNIPKFVLAINQE